jgi:hypothetical protein
LSLSEFAVPSTVAAAGTVVAWTGEAGGTGGDLAFASAV